MDWSGMACADTHLLADHLYRTPRLPAGRRNMLLSDGHRNTRTSEALGKWKVLLSNGSDQVLAECPGQVEDQPGVGFGRQRFVVDILGPVASREKLWVKSATGNCHTAIGKKSLEILADISRKLRRVVYCSQAFFLFWLAYNVLENSPRLMGLYSRSGKILPRLA